MIEPRRLIVDAAASGEDYAPLAVRVVGAGDVFAADEGMDEGRNVFRREASDQTAGDAGELIVHNRSVVSAVLMEVAFNLSAEVELIAMLLLLASIIRRSPAFRPLARARLNRWLGDLGAQGKGELLIADVG